MKSLFSSIINIILIASVIIVIFILVLNSEQNSKVLRLESSDTINNYTSQIISIKQLDSLSASANLQFSKFYANTLLPAELR